MGPGGFLFLLNTNPDLADILGDMDFDFANVYFLDFFGSQISGLGPAWAQLRLGLGPAWAQLGPSLGPAWARLGPGLGPRLGPPWAHLGPSLGPAGAPRLGRGPQPGRRRRRQRRRRPNSQIPT